MNCVVQVVMFPELSTCEKGVEFSALDFAFYLCNSLALLVIFYISVFVVLWSLMFYMKCGVLNME